MFQVLSFEHTWPRVHLHTWQLSLVFSNIQWESRRTDFPIMDSCGVVLLKAASTRLFCSAADCSLTFMSAVSIKTHYSQCAVKDERLPQMLAYGTNTKSVCLYSNVWLQAPARYPRLLFWNLICLESFHYHKYYPELRPLFPRFNRKQMKTVCWSGSC